VSLLKIAQGATVLRPKGAPERGRYIGLCPLHEEATPSFVVDAVKGFFHCFGCGQFGYAKKLAELLTLKYRKELK
jgi:DNA primase